MCVSVSMILSPLSELLERAPGACSESRCGGATVAAEAASSRRANLRARRAQLVGYPLVPMSGKDNVYSRIFPSISGATRLGCGLRGPVFWSTRVATSPETLVASALRYGLEAHNC
jgi:hypothetical protein